MVSLKSNTVNEIQAGDSIPIPPYLPTLTFAVNKFFERVKKLTNAQPIILDVGCGNRSDLSQYLRANSNNIIIHGIDIDEYAKDNPDVDQVYIGSAEKMPFEDEIYDMVFSQFLLEHVEDAHKTLASMARVLKKDGTLIITIPNPASPEGMVTKLTPYSFHVKFKRVVEKVDDAHQNTFPTRYSFKSVKNIKSILHDLGFKIVEAHYIAESFYRFRRRPILGNLSILYTKLLSLLHLDRFQSSVVIMAIKS
jgi:ubiquinone/menaquinone biosynthesis C-methylase UbiE